MTGTVEADGRIIVLSGTKAATGTLTLRHAELTPAYRIIAYSLGEPANKPAAWSWDTDTPGEVHIKDTWLGSTTITVVLGIPRL